MHVLLIQMQVLLHTRVPLIKGEARTYIDPVTGDAVSSDTEGAEELKVSVDISIDGPEHSGKDIAMLGRACKIQTRLDLCHYWIACV